MAQITYDRALNKAMAICSKSEKCVSDIEKKLAEWEVRSNDILKIIQMLQSEKFVDEQRYASYYTKDKFRFNKWGKVKIGYMLKAKNIPQNFIQEAIDEIDDETYFSVLKQLLQQKKKSIKAQSEYELKAKLTRFAQGRGFDYESISKVLTQL